jgi:hypothetical protein
MEELLLGIHDDGLHGADPLGLGEDALVILLLANVHRHGDDGQAMRRELE